MRTANLHTSLLETKPRHLLNRIEYQLQLKTRQDNVEVADAGTTVPLCPDLNYPFQKYNINYYLMRFLNEFRLRSGWLSNQTLLPGYTSTSLKHTGEIRHTSIASARVAESECGLLRQFCARNCGKIARKKTGKFLATAKKLKQRFKSCPVYTILGLYHCHSTSHRPTPTKNTPKSIPATE